MWAKLIKTVAVMRIWPFVALMVVMTGHVSAGGLPYSPLMSVRLDGVLKLLPDFGSQAPPGTLDYLCVIAADGRSSILR